MKQPPRDPKTPVITRKMISKIAQVTLTKFMRFKWLQGALIMNLGTLVVFFNSLVENDPEQRYATTLAFTTFVMFQMFNALNCRSATQSVTSLGIFR